MKTTTLVSTLFVLTLAHSAQAELVVGRHVAGGITRSVVVDHRPNASTGLPFGRNEHIPTAFAEAKAATIFGADNRTVINDASKFPWSANGRLWSYFPNNSTRNGSFTMIGVRHALTAAHCVYNSQLGGYATRVVLAPGLSGTVYPFGSAEAQNIWVPGAYFQSGGGANDWAVIKLDSPLGLFTGAFAYGDDTVLNNTLCHLSAYDSDVQNNFQKYRFGSVTDDGLICGYQFDTFGGSSGGGVYRFINNVRRIVAVNVKESADWNIGCRITMSRAAAIDAIKLLP